MMTLLVYTNTESLGTESFCEGLERDGSLVEVDPVHSFESRMAQEADKVRLVDFQSISQPPAWFVSALPSAVDHSDRRPVLATQTGGHKAGLDWQGVRARVADRQPRTHWHPP